MKLISFFRLPYCRRCSGKLWLWSLSDDNQPTLTGATRYLLYCFNRYTRKNSTFYLTFWNNWWDILITSLYVFCCWYRLYLRLVWKKVSWELCKNRTITYSSTLLVCQIYPCTYKMKNIHPQIYCIHRFFFSSTSFKLKMEWNEMHLCKNQENITFNFNLFWVFEYKYCWN